MNNLELTNATAVSHEAAEHQVRDCVAQNHPEWVDQDGECQACVSISHELSDPHYIPGDLTSL